MATAIAPTVILFLLLHIFTVGSVLQADTADIEPNSVWIVEPSEVEIAVNHKPYTLQCHSALPNVTYRWMFNNRTLDLVNDSRRQILYNGSLFFKTVWNKSNKKTGDAGSYRCIVQTPSGAVSSKTITLLIAAINNFDKSPSNITVSSDTSRSVIRFTCHIDSIPEATIKWQKDGVVVPNNKRFITKVPGVLYIKDVNERDVGNYSCVGKNHLLNRTKSSKVGYLNIRTINNSSGSHSDIQPMAFISPSSYMEIKYVTEGDNVTFECAATGVPSPQLNWSFMTSTGNKYNTMHVDEETSVNVLSLTNVSTKDSGTYTCHASQFVSGWPDFPHVQVFRLEVMTPPIITVKPETQTMPIANTIRFRCEAKGNPTPEITWYLNGQHLKLHGRIKIKDPQILLVSNTVSNDSGVYQCFASNRYGTTWAGALFIISSSPYEPAPPINISCRTLSPTQIQVSWRKSPTNIPIDPPIIVRDDSIQLNPHNGAPSSAMGSIDTTNKVFRAYSIHYMLTDGGEETQQVSVNHSIIVERLKPYKNYTFYVRVYNGKSGSDQSEKVTCKTQDGAPQTVPELIVTSLSPISLHVEWSEINVNMVNGAITQYQVMWRRFHGESNYIQVLPKEARQYTITGLKPSEQYEVQVLGATQNGLPNVDFSWQIVELPPVNPVLPIPDLSFSTDADDQSIMLSWSVDEKLVNTFDNYRLMYRGVTSQTNHSMMSVHILRRNVDSYRISYTSDMDIYEVLLNCLSVNGEGESISKTITVVLDVLSPPSQVEAVAISLHTLNLSWVPPDSDDPSSLLFIITYNSVSNFSQNSTTVFTDQGVTSYELSGLKPYNLYEIKISAQDKNKKSEFSQKIQIRTLQGVPGIVEQIDWQWINTSTVRITWVEPMKSNGVIMGYYVSYTSDLIIPPTSWQQLNVSRHKTSLDLYDLNNNTQYFFMVRAATDAGFGPQSGISSIKPLTSLVDLSLNSKHPGETPALYMEDEQLLGIVIGCVIGVCCILICTTSIVLKRQCMKSERVRNTQHNTLGNDVAYCTQHLRPLTVDHVQHEESVPLNDTNYITRHMDGRGSGGRYLNNMSGMTLLPLLDSSNVGDDDLTNVHIIENPRCTVDVDAYDVDSLLSESAEGGAGTEDSGCSDQLAKSQKGGDSSVIDDGFHEHVEPNKLLVG